MTNTIWKDIKIAGIQKLTLLDYPEKTAAILFLPGCNMKCPFCHNYTLANGSTYATLNNNDIYQYLLSRRKLLDGIVITGGEPSNQNIIPLLTTIKEIGYQIKIDTNGLRPNHIQEWLDKNLIDYIAMDVKNSSKKYAQTCGMTNINLNLIQKSIRIIMESTIDYEFRTTLIPNYHSIEDIQDIGKNLIKNAKKYYLQPFVTRDTVPDKTLKEPSDQLLIDCINAVKPYVQHVEIRGRDIKPNLA